MDLENLAIIGAAIGGVYLYYRYMNSPQHTAAVISSTGFTPAYSTPSGQIVVHDTNPYLPASYVNPNTSIGKIYVLYNAAGQEVRQVDPGYVTAPGETVYAFVTLGGALVDSSKTYYSGTPSAMAAIPGTLQGIAGAWF